MKIIDHRIIKVLDITRVLTDAPVDVRLREALGAECKTCCSLSDIVFREELRFGGGSSWSSEYCRWEFVRIGDRDECVVWIEALCKRLITGGGEDEVGDGDLGLLRNWSLTKRITTFWSDEDDCVWEVWE